MTIRQTIAQWFYSPGAYGLWLALDDAENWTIEDHVALYRDRGKNMTTFRREAVAAMWISGGAKRFDGYGISPEFLGKWERRWLWRKYKKMVKHKEWLARTEGNRSMLYRFTRLEEPE